MKGNNDIFQTDFQLISTEFPTNFSLFISTCLKITADNQLIKIEIHIKCTKKTQIYTFFDLLTW